MSSVPGSTKTTKMTKSTKPTKSTKRPFRSSKGEKPKFKKKVCKTKREQMEIEALTDKYKKYDPNSAKTFLDLPLSTPTQRGLKECAFATPTEIQRQSIGLALEGRDILGAAKTGSGKTLAFVIPMLEKLFTLRWAQQDGLGALVITPTRELALQIFEQLRTVGKYHEFSAGLVIGGKDLRFESQRMAECNIVICTPGRILQHMDENPVFDAANLKMLVLDEADRCLEMGFSEQMNAILSNLPTEDRQTLLFSATQTRSIKDLARLSLKSPVFVSVHEHASKMTPDELSEHYVICDLEQKIDMLWSFVKNHKKKKILVFVQSCKQAKYYRDLLKRLRVPTPVLSLYGTLKQLKRMAIYKDFCGMSHGVLIATDIAARGLDFPTVDWVLQLDCPEDWKTYNHRVGRTARNQAAGQALMVLMPSEEEAMLKQLRIHKFPVEKIEVNPRKISTVSRKLESFLAGDRELKDDAQRAFLSYLKSIFLMKDKSVFNVTELDTDAFAASLGLAVPPRVRFIKKHLAKNASKQEEEKKKTKKTVIKLSDSEGEDEDDILKVKRVNHELSDEELEEGDLDLDHFSRPSNKIVTKAAIAKKLLKKNIQANQKITFADSGEIMADSNTQKLSTEGQNFDREAQSSTGIDFEKAREVLKAEDKFDKIKERQRIRELHKEQKRKEKEAKNKRRKEQAEGKEDDEEEAVSESDSESEDNLSWLPDPDKIYGKQNSEEDDSSEDDSAEEENDSEPQKKRKWKPPKKPSKKAKKNDDEEEEEEDLQNLNDDEQFALSLLGK